MNGVHDMGGMHGLGPIAPEREEPVFHHAWEARVLALTLASPSRWNIDASRHQRELIPGPEYLRMTYYEKWFRSLSELLVIHGIVSAGEAASGRPDPGAPEGTPRLSADMVETVLRSGGPANREVAVVAGFKPGDRVRAKILNPTGHTRLPRYVRGHEGVIDRDHGVHVFPDANAHFQGEQPHHVYSVRFEARDLWGQAAGARDGIYVDLWERHLEPA
jgi:nitrile hydratase beta subunit